MGIYKEPFFFIIIFFFVVFVLFLYTQFNINKKQITIINSKGESITVTVELANNPIKRARGLMFRSALDENEGMLFIFDRPGRYGFWMFNTTIPLDAIFFDENGTVVDIITMEPCTTINCPVYTPTSEALYVLEVNRGFSVANKIELGKSRLVIE